MKDELHLLCFMVFKKVRISYLFCIRGTAYLIYCLVLSRFFKIKVFFNCVVLLPYAFTLFRTAGHMTRKHQANWMCLYPKVSSLVAG